ncbi:hypothetical protein GCM10028895_44270 [Pontibacter rugosus]
MVDMNEGANFTNFQAYKLEYKDGKVTKRTGGQECVFDNSCQGKSLLDQFNIVDDVTYGKNTISIINRSGDSQWDIRHWEWLIKLKNPSQIEYLLRKIENHKLYDSLRYVYDADNRLKQIIKYRVYEDEYEKFAIKDGLKDFFFNTAGNLEKVETRRLLHDGFVIKMVLERFDDYDTAVNPFRSLFMFDDTFYRSLSNNNFRKYRRQEVELPNGILYDTQGRDWDLECGDANWPFFDKL